MENQIKTEINISQFAKSLAQGNDYEQSELINKFAMELKICCKDIQLTGLQSCNIAEKLDSNGIDLIKSLYEFILLREQSQPK